MRLSTAGLLTAALLVTTACEPMDSVPLNTDDQKASYALGLNVGTQLESTSSLLETDAFMKGFEDALAGADPQIPVEELQPILQAFDQRVREARMAAMEAEGEANRAEGEAYLAENGARPEVTTTSSGLQYEVLVEGDGARPGPSDQVRIHYRGTLINGDEFDSSYKRGQPASFGVGGVIPGFSEGLQLMPVGSTYRLYIPSDLGYGPQGTGRDIGPNATLIFEVEMLEVVGG